MRKIIKEVSAVHVSGVRFVGGVNPPSGMFVEARIVGVDDRNHIVIEPIGQGGRQSIHDKRVEEFLDWAEAIRVFEMDSANIGGQIPEQGFSILGRDINLDSPRRGSRDGVDVCGIREDIDQKPSQGRPGFTLTRLSK